MPEFGKWRGPLFPCARGKSAKSILLFLFPGSSLEKYLETHFIQIFQDRAAWAFSLKHHFGQLVQSLHFILCFFNHPLHSTQITWLCTLVQQVDIDMLRNRILSP